MFIKKAYERRLKNELGENTQSKARIRPKLHKIGSVKNGRINYDKDEQFFAIDDIPIQAKNAHDEIVEFIDPDLLELRQRPWNPSVLVPKNPILEETFERKLIKIKLGLMDQPAPGTKDVKIEPGCDTRNYYTGWNVSVEQNLRERNKALLLQTEKGLMNTKLKEELLVKEYVKPVDFQMNLTAKLREEKLQEKPLREEIRANYKFQNPTASKEKTDGAVFRLTYEKKLTKDQKNVDDPTGILGRPDLSKTLKEYKTNFYIHNGVWQEFKKKMKGKEDDQFNGEYEKVEEVKSIFAWSCCLNENHDSDGCHKIVKDKYRWNYTSP